MEPSASGASQTWKVGALAKSSGVTVRTLHHYDQIGLLRPQGQTASGHRLYQGADIVRLYRILALRRLGFALSDIAALLDDPGWTLASMLQRHSQAVERSIAVASQLRTHLRAFTAELDQSGAAAPEALFTVWRR